MIGSEVIAPQKFVSIGSPWHRLHRVIGLRQILRSPRLTLVGQLVHSRDKLGRDFGELVGEPSAGVIATDNLDGLLGLGSQLVQPRPNMLRPERLKFALADAGDDVEAVAGLTVPYAIYLAEVARTSLHYALEVRHLDRFCSMV